MFQIQFCIWKGFRIPDTIPYTKTYFVCQGELGNTSMSILPSKNGAKASFGKPNHHLTSAPPGGPGLSRRSSAISKLRPAGPWQHDTMAGKAMTRLSPMPKPS